MPQAAEQRANEPAMLKDGAFEWQDPRDLGGEFVPSEADARGKPAHDK